MNPTQAVIDADTANEVDDLFAIVRTMTEPSLDIRGLCSAQWQGSHYASPDTLEDSQRLNEALLDLMRIDGVPLPRGAHKRLYDWGQTQAHHCHAAYHIIQEAHRMAQGQKLVVFGLAGQTNLASALMIDPSIASKIDLWLLGTSYLPERQLWNKLDFNCMMDPRAMDHVLSCPDLETTILPANAAQEFRLTYAETKERLDQTVPVYAYLMHRWYSHVDGSRIERVMWDLALIELFLDPGQGRWADVTTPVENAERPVRMCLEINAPALKETFFTRMAAVKPGL
jgi:inosine-uridine nucleoside N-ribohydrolase